MFVVYFVYSVMSFLSKLKVYVNEKNVNNAGCRTIYRFISGSELRSISNGNRTECSPIRSVIQLIIKITISEKRKLAKL